MMKPNHSKTVTRGRWHAVLPAGLALAALAWSGPAWPDVFLSRYAGAQPVIQRAVGKTEVRVDRDKTAERPHRCDLAANRFQSATQRLIVGLNLAAASRGFACLCLLFHLLSPWPRSGRNFTKSGST